MGFIYFVYKYNLIYSYDADIDTKGLLYPNALMQLFVGLYLSEVCLIGLFALHTALGPLLLMILFLVFTAMIHLSLSNALGPLLNNLPRTLCLQDQSLSEDPTTDPTLNPLTANNTPPEVQGGAASDYYNIEEGFGMEPDLSLNPDPGLDQDTTPRAIEGAPTLLSSLRQLFWHITTDKIAAEASDSGLTRFLSRIVVHLTPDPDVKPSFLMKFFHPEVYEDFRVLSEMMPPGPPEAEVHVPEQIARRGYLPPEMWTPTPKLWIPRDEARVSRQEVRHTRDCVGISDRGAWLDERGRIQVEMEMAPFKEPRVLY